MRPTTRTCRSLRNNIHISTQFPALDTDAGALATLAQLLPTPRSLLRRPVAPTPVLTNLLPQLAAAVAFLAAALALFATYTPGSGGLDVFADVPTSDV